MSSTQVHERVINSLLLVTKLPLPSNTLFSASKPALANIKYWCCESYPSYHVRLKSYSAVRPVFVMAAVKDTDKANPEPAPPSAWTVALVQTLLVPYTWLVISHRPDVTNCKTRKEHWTQLRSQWRWVHAVFSYLGPPSHVLWNIKWPLLGNLCIAGVAMADAIAVRDLVLDESINDAGVLSWRFSSFMLSLLMAFRVNRVYDRWWSGRQSFAGVGNAAYSLARQSIVWIKDQQLRAEMIRWCKVWHFSSYGLLKGEKTLHPLVADLLDKDESAYYAKARKGRNLVTLRLQQLINSAELNQTQLLMMEQTLAKGIADQGMCTRIMFQCMPYGLTLMCSGFLEIYLLLMPFGLFDSNSMPGWTWRTSAFEMLLYALMCVLMLGVDEVTSQLEQPFPHMPLFEIAESTVRDITSLEDQAVVMADLGQQHMWRAKQQQDDEEAAAGAAPNRAMATKDVMTLKLDQPDSSADLVHMSVQL